ncbi:MAG: hypothetical protein ACK559_15150, partial [bacterium]
FKVTMDREVLAYLGINLEHRNDGSIKLTQDKLQHDILSEYDTQTKLEGNKYLRLLGQLSYLTHSRPDLLTLVSYHASKAKDPSDEDCKSLLKIVTLLRQTTDKGLILYPKSNDDDDKIYITAMVDAAYMSHEDAGSHTGYCISVGSKTPKSYFYSKSYKQKLTATSSTHAEVRALY